MKEMEKIPERLYRRIVIRIDSLKYVPRPVDTLKLKGYENRWRIRMGDYRILYEIDDQKNSVIVFRVVHRKEAYR